MAEVGCWIIYRARRGSAQILERIGYGLDQNGIKHLAPERPKPNPDPYKSRHTQSGMSQQGHILSAGFWKNLQKPFACYRGHVSDTTSASWLSRASTV